MILNCDEDLCQVQAKRLCPNCALMLCDLHCAQINGICDQCDLVMEEPDG